jgi:hypothetical protein
MTDNGSRLVGNLLLAETISFIYNPAWHALYSEIFDKSPIIGHRSSNFPEHPAPPYAMIPTHPN